MKKIQYITPSIIVTDVKVQNILAVSLGVDTTKETNTQYGKGAILDLDDEEEEDF